MTTPDPPNQPDDDDQPKQREPRNRAPIQRVVDLGVCAKCGQVHLYCKGHLNRTNFQVPCKRNACKDLLLCHVHGGANPASKAKAKRLRDEREAHKALQRALGANAPVPVTDPHAELARLAGEAVAAYDAAETLVANLGDDLISADGSDVHPFVKLFERMADRKGRIITDMTKLGFVERRVQIEEAQHAILGEALRAVLARNGIDAERVLPDLAAELRRRDAIETHALEAGDGEVDDDD